MELSNIIEIFMESDIENIILWDSIFCICQFSVNIRFKRISMSSNNYSHVSSRVDSTVTVNLQLTKIE